MVKATSNKLQARDSVGKEVYFARVQWLTPVITALWKAEGGGWLNPRYSRPAWATWWNLISLKIIIPFEWFSMSRITRLRGINIIYKMIKEIDVLCRKLGKYKKSIKKKIKHHLPPRQKSSQAFGIELGPVYMQLCVLFYLAPCCKLKHFSCH